MVEGPPSPVASHFTIYAWIITAAQFIITKYDENQQVEAFQ